MQSTFNITVGSTGKRSKWTPKAITIDWDTLSDVSRDFLVAYGIKQYCADGVAAAESQTDFDDGIAARLENIAKGDFARKSGDGPSGLVDDPTTLAKRNARAEFLTAIKGADLKFTKEEKAEVIAAYFEEHKDRLLSEAKAEIETRKGKASTIDVKALLAKFAKTK